MYLQAFGGFFVSLDSVPVWLSWLQWLSPFKYSFTVSCMTCKVISYAYVSALTFRSNDYNLPKNVLYQMTKQMI